MFEYMRTYIFLQNLCRYCALQRLGLTGEAAHWGLGSFACSIWAFPHLAQAQLRSTKGSYADFLFSAPVQPYGGFNVANVKEAGLKGVT